MLEPHDFGRVYILHAFDLKSYHSQSPVVPESECTQFQSRALSAVATFLFVLPPFLSAVRYL